MTELDNEKTLKAAQTVLEFKELQKSENLCIRAKYDTFADKTWITCDMLPNEKLNIDFLKEHCMKDSTDKCEYCQTYYDTRLAEHIEAIRKEEESELLAEHMEAVRKEEEFELDDLENMTDSELYDLYKTSIIGDFNSTAERQYAYMEKHHLLVHKLNLLTTILRMHNLQGAKNSKLLNISDARELYKSIVREF